MPPTRELAMGAWGVTLLGLAWRQGIRAVLTALPLGTAAVLSIVALFPDQLAAITGLFPKKAVESEVQKAREAARRELSQEHNLKRTRSSISSSTGESVEWLNFLVLRLWPHIETYVVDLIRGFEPMIQDAVPLAGKSITFSKCRLGEVPLKFGPVKPSLVDACYNNAVVKDGGVELKIGVTYTSDVDIELSTPMFKVGVANLSISGTISILFRPLMGKMPLIGGMEIIFTNPPKVNLEFHGIGKIADMPGIYSAVRKVVNDAIAGILVTPNRKAFTISEDEAVDLARLKNPAPDGVLRITAIKAENLEGNDVNIMNPLGQLTADPYVAVRVGAQTWNTPHIVRSLNPVWESDNVHDFFVFSKAQQVHMKVMDYDRLDADDELGEIEHLTVEDVLAARAGAEPTNFKLLPREGDKPPPEDARLHVRFEWLQLVPPSEGAARLASGPNRYVMEFKIDECCGLPQDGLGAPFVVRMSVKGDAEGGKVTKQGWAKAATVATPDTLRHARKLHDNAVDTALIGEVLGLDAQLVKGLLETDAGKTDPGKKRTRSDVELDQEWIAKVQADHAKRHSSCNPQFEEVLRLPMPEMGNTIVLELLNSAKKPEVVGRFETKADADVATEGPFTLLDPATGEPLSKDSTGVVKLYGTLMLWQLAKSDAPRPTMRTLEAFCDS